jgi:hypothetical protein
MPNRLLIAALAATMSLVATAQVSADTVKKKKKTAVQTEQSEKSAEQEAMEDAVFDAALGVFGNVAKKGKMPKGGKEILKQGLKAVKNAKKDADKNKSGKKDTSKKKDPLKALFGGGDEE